MPSIDELLKQAATLHRDHLCPRQVLGVRMSLGGGEALGLEVPRTDKRLIAFVEINGCGADGISVGSGCWFGRRTLYLFDFGKLAVTFVDTLSGEAVRVVPRPTVRERAKHYAPDAKNKWAAQLEGYRIMPTEELLSVQPVTLNFDIEELISRPGLRVACEVCGEEIINEREIIREGSTLCRACAGEAYYRPAAIRHHLSTSFRP